MIAHISDIPTVVSPASASNQARRLGSCDWCSNCGHVANESSDTLSPLRPEREDIIGWRSYPRARAWMETKAVESVVEVLR